MTARPHEDDVEQVDWEAEEAREIAETPTGYVSPLLQRVSTTRLTPELLRAEVPIAQAGTDAAKRLENATSRMGEKTRARLQAQRIAGEQARQRLFEAALPLIRAVARREYQRRQQWGSQITFEDLVQEASVGFLKGVSSFRVDSIGRSATNYLGQWMLVEMRRASEAFDHDMQVGHDAGERFRRVRALRNRLATDLGRAPTDEEIAEASRNPDYVIRPGLVGRAPVDGKTVHVGKGLTESQVAEERTFRTRIGQAIRIGGQEGGDMEEADAPRDASRISVAEAGEIGPSPDLTPEEHVAAADETLFIARLVGETLDALRLPDAQREIIARRFGIPPHSEMSAREIARIMGIQREKVSRILAAFQEEMTRSGGAFHATIVRYDEEDLLAAGLGWAVNSLGPWTGPVAATSELLVAELSTKPASKRAAKPAGSTRARGAIAWFQCDFHDSVFQYLYPNAQSAPRKLPCPRCGKDSDRIKTVTTDL